MNGRKETPEGRDAEAVPGNGLPSATEARAVSSDPKAFLIPGWMFWLAAVLVSATISGTLAFVDLATKQDLEQLAAKGDLTAVEEELARLQRNVGASAGCVRENVDAVREFAISLAKWAESHSHVQVALFGTYREAPEMVLNHFELLAMSGVHSILLSKQDPGSPLRVDAPLRKHVEILQDLEGMYSNFEMDAQRCVTLLRVEGDGG